MNPFLDKRDLTNGLRDFFVMKEKESWGFSLIYAITE